MDWSVFFSIIGGGLITIGVAVFVEYFRKPRLGLKIVDPKDDNYRDLPANRIRWLRLMVENKQIPRLLKWLSRNAAIHCSGSITFHHLDGQNVFGRSMQARWFGPREPLPITAVAEGGQRIQIFDPLRLAPEIHRDIYSGGSEQLDVVARFDNDVECYGWCNDNYRSNPPWRNPDWKLSSETHLVEVTIFCSGERYNELFRLINDVPVNAFRFEKAQPNDYKVILAQSKQGDSNPQR